MDKKEIRLKEFLIGKAAPGLEDKVPVLTNDAPESFPNENAVRALGESDSLEWVFIDPLSRNIGYVAPIRILDSFHVSPFPHPALMYLEFARRSIESADLLRSRMAKDYVPGRLVHYTENYSAYHEFVRHKTGALIFLICGLEVFINAIIPDGHVVEWKSKPRDKAGIERFLPLKEKIGSILVEVFKRDFRSEHPESYRLVLEALALRDELIHVKTAREKSGSHRTIQAYGGMMNMDLEPHFRAAVQFLNYYEPGLVTHVVDDEPSPIGFANH